MSVATEVRMESGARVRIGALIDAGGQGKIFRAQRSDTGETGVFKAFEDRSPEIARRVEYLVSRRLDRLCPVLHAPVDWVVGDPTAHFSALAPGVLLEDFLANPDNTFVEGLQYAAAVAHALAVLHGQGIAHGDIQARNVLVNRNGGVLEAYLIDFDNFVAPHLPPPPCLGQQLYLAPELHESTGAPGIEADLYALGVLMSEILLWRHPATGMDEDEQRFAEAMYGGRWLHDPANSTRPKARLAGYPPTVLDSAVSGLMRRAFSRTPSERPRAAEWVHELAGALYRVDQCPTCNGPNLIDSSKTRCPICGTGYPVLALVTAGGQSIRLAGASTVVGREKLGGELTVSGRHAVFRRSGPDVYIESEGLNGTFRFAHGHWARLPDRKQVLIRAGDRLRLGKVEAEVQTVP